MFDVCISSTMYSIIVAGHCLWLLPGPPRHCNPLHMCSQVNRSARSVACEGAFNILHAETDMHIRFHELAQTRLHLLRDCFIL